MLSPKGQNIPKERNWNEQGWKNRHRIIHQSHPLKIFVRHDRFWSTWYLITMRNKSSCLVYCTIRFSTTYRLGFDISCRYIYICGTFSLRLCRNTYGGVWGAQPGKTGGHAVRTSARLLAFVLVHMMMEYISWEPCIIAVNAFQYISFKQRNCSRERLCDSLRFL